MSRVVNNINMHDNSSVLDKLFEEFPHVNLPTPRIVF